MCLFRCTKQGYGMSIRGSYHRVAFPSKESRKGLCIFPELPVFVYDRLPPPTPTHIGEACSFTESLQEDFDEARARQPWRTPVLFLIKMCRRLSHAQLLATFSERSGLSFIVIRQMSKQFTSKLFLS